MSSAPEYYEPGYDFTDFQETNPDTPLPADELDIQLEAIATAINTTQDRLAEIQNDDGSLKHGIVGGAQLSGDITIGMRAAVVWESGAAYEENDTVYNGNRVYRCDVSHTGTDFAPDLAAGKWELILDFDQYLSAASASADSANDASVNAQSQAATAVSSAETAVQSLEAFQDTYLGAHEYPPETSTSGAPLADGMMYFSTGSHKLMVRNAGIWFEAAAAINGTFARTEAAGNGWQTDFAVSYDPGNLLVYVAGQLMDRDHYAAYNGSAVTFNSAPADGARIDFIALGVFNVGDVADASIDTSNLQDGAVTPAKCEPGAYWYDAGILTEGVVELNPAPALPALTEGTIITFSTNANDDQPGKSITSITSSGTTATVTCTGHGLPAGSSAIILGADQIEYNGFFVVESVPTADTFTYKFKGSGTSPATGTLMLDTPVLGYVNSGSVGLDVNGLGVKELVRGDGNQLLPGDVLTSAPRLAIFANNKWHLQADVPPQLVYAFCDSTDGEYYAISNQFRMPTNKLPLLLNLKVVAGNSVTDPVLDYVNSASYPLTGTIYREGGRPLRLGDMAGGEWAQLQWCGSHWELLNPKVNRRPIAILQHQTAGAGGSATNTVSWFDVRSLNTVASDPEGIVALSSNQFTLSAGTYEISFSAQCQMVGTTVGRILNVTDNTVAFYGQSAYLNAISGQVTGTGVVTITGTKNFRLEQRNSTARANDGYGAPHVYVSPNIYITVRIEKLV